MSLPGSTSLRFIDSKRGTHLDGVHWRALGMTIRSFMAVTGFKSRRDASFSVVPFGIPIGYL